MEVWLMKNLIGLTLLVVILTAACSAPADSQADDLVTVYALEG
jgi:hypothetical protein